MTAACAWMELGLIRSIAGGACALLAACGTGSHGGTGSTSGPPDGMPDADPLTVTIRLTSTADLQLIAFRDGPGAPWQTPVPTQPGRYEIAVHGPYTVLDVCTAPGEVATFERSRTLDDPHDLDMSCLVRSPRGSHVTGSITPVQGGGIFPIIYIGAVSGTPAANGQFDVQVVDGTYDLVAWTLSLSAGQDRIAIRRNLVVAGDTMVMPAIDVATEGTATMLVQPTVTNLAADEQLGTSSELDTPTVKISASIGGSTTTTAPGAYLLPDAALGPDDVQWIDVSASSDTTAGSFTARDVSRRYTQSTSLQFTLPPAFSVPFTTVDGQLVAAWTTLPPLDRLEVAIDQASATGTDLDRLSITNVSANYIAATAATSAGFDTDVPGYDPSWRVDLSRAYDRQATAIRTVDGDVLDASLNETIIPQLTGPPSVPQPRGGPSPALRRRSLARMQDR